MTKQDMANTTNEDDIEFLYHGDIWEALFGKECSKYVPRIISHGIRKASAVYASDDYNFFEYRPEKSLISYIYIIKCEGGMNSFYSGFPFLKGLENNLVFCDTHNGEDDDPMEGYVLLKKGNAAPMWMYNPLYAQQKALFKELFCKGDQLQPFCIAGIGWNIEKRTDTHVQINEGTLYENALRDFLKENPDKIADDFPYVTLNARHLNCLFAIQYEDAYEFASDILAIKKFKYYGLKFYCLEIEVLIGADETKQGMKVNLYVNKKSLGDYVPQIGDNILGLMQLTAYINTNQYFENADECSKEGFLRRMYKTFITFWRNA